MGLSWKDQDGITLDLGGAIDGGGVSGYDAYNVSGRLKLDF